MHCNFIAKYIFIHNVLLLPVTVTYQSFPGSCTKRTRYRYIKEGPWEFNDVHTNEKFEYSVRVSLYFCNSSSAIILTSMRDFKMPSSKYGFMVPSHFPEYCTGECNSKWVNITLFRTVGSSMHIVHLPSYLEKNCDKLYWSDWVETSNCSLSSNVSYSRVCVDCYGNKAIKALAPLCNGASTKSEKCTTSSCGAISCMVFGIIFAGVLVFAILCVFIACFIRKKRFSRISNLRRTTSTKQNVYSSLQTRAVANDDAHKRETETSQFAAGFSTEAANRNDDDYMHLDEISTFPNHSIPNSSNQSKQNSPCDSSTKEYKLPKSPKDQNH